MNELSPMMQQYINIKKEHKDEILFFRLGDFYEMFFDDAVLVSRELDITLTGKNCGMQDRAPMCGIPYHSCEAYISRLIAKGYKIALCEQKEEPNGKTIVRREVSHIITPGTVVDSSMLDESRNNFLCVIFFLNLSAGICFCDISTGELKITHFSGSDFLKKIENHIKMFSPKEILISGDYPEKFKNHICKSCIVSLRDAQKDFESKHDTIVDFLKHRLKIDSSNIEFCESNQKGFLFSRCVAMLFSYLLEIQKKEINFIKNVEIYEGSEFLSFECGAVSNLELFETIRTKQKKGSLFWVLDKTRTSMGKRLLRSWIERPLLNTDKIKSRLEGVEELISNVLVMDDLHDFLGKIGDIQRLLGKISFGSANCRDLKSLSSSISMFTNIRLSIKDMKSGILRKIFNNIDELRDVFSLIESSIVDDPPILTRDGGFIKQGFNKDLDEILNDRNAGESLADKIEKKEQQRTGIPKLKIGYNKVFGYYIEISQIYKDKVPKEYIRKQTLTGKERYITEELKSIESRIFSAKERSIKLENEIFQQIKLEISKQSERISRTAKSLAALDVLRSFADVSSENSYVKPILDNSDILDLKNCRHPVIEKLLNGQKFIPNDAYFDENIRTMVITGPNMAGKSTYMRQIALNVILAQIGCFVAADNAHIGIIDSIFTRIGASDDVASGQSTFMVEMNEVAQITLSASPKSLVLLDEIGRGTSTFDGLSIARSVLEFMSSKIKSKTLFSTHYHEISNNELEYVRNFNIAVKKDGDDIVFLRKIVDGSSDDSYGIEVAKLAGVHENIISRAKSILQELEHEDISINKQNIYENENNTNENIIKILKNIKLNSLTPIESMNILSELIKMV